MAKYKGMQFKHLLYTLFVVTIFSACGEKQNSFTVIADIKGIPSSYVYLEDISTDNFIVVDSAMPTGTGKFELSGNTVEQGLFRLRLSPRDFILLSVDKGNIQINADWSELHNYQVKGSEATASISSLLKVVRSYLNEMNEVQFAMDTLYKARNQEGFAQASETMSNLNMNLTRYVEQYADTTPYAPNAIFAARMLPAGKEAFMESFIPSLKKRFPDAKMANDFIAKHEEKQAQLAAQKAATAHLNIGQPAPEISLPTPEGDIVNLQSFKGKYVLIDFWASWCGPCRRENPNVVKAYNKFKNKNFTILGVSLDEDKDKWQQAIEKDGLTWTHVSDLKGWQSIAARDYNVNSIPANYLIDPDGRIIATNLREEALHAKLAEVLQ